MQTQTSTKCDNHPGQPAIGCRACLIDARIDGDTAAVARWHASLGALECDARLPEKWRRANADHPALIDWLALYTDNPQSCPWLLLVGPVGRGKTYLAHAALRTIATSGRPITWEAGKASDFYAALRPRDKHDSEAVMTIWRRADLVLLDDLGAAKLTEWAEEQTLRLIDARDEHARLTIITTNVETTRLKDTVGDRIASRLAELCRGGVIVLDGPDRRRKTATTIEGDSK